MATDTKSYDDAANQSSSASQSDPRVTKLAGVSPVGHTVSHRANPGASSLRGAGPVRVTSGGLNSSALPAGALLAAAAAGAFVMGLLAFLVRSASEDGTE